MENKNLLKDSKAYYEDNNYYEIFSLSEDYIGKVNDYIKNIVKDKIVVDAGCGTGKYLNTIEKKSKKYIGIDLSAKQLEKAKQKSQKDNSIFINSNLSSIPLDDNSVDLIISAWVLGTITDLSEREKCLNELKRILKNNASIILIENAENSEFEVIRGRNRDSRTKDYNDWLKKHGFTEDKHLDTYFNFNDLEIAKKCFEVIYGTEISNKINSHKIEHKITIFKYSK